jgi:beta-lactamase superfamily II metal-dependent hydrolase
MVVRVEAPGGSALLCGDIQAEAMARLLAADDAGGLSLRADVMELPHHGSFHEVAVEFVNRVDPGVVLQSTGQRRWSSDRWAAPLAGRERLVTARDGACGVRVGGRGGIVVHRYHPRE